MQEKVLKQIWRVRSQFRGKVNWFLLQANISAHAAMPVKCFLAICDLVGNQAPTYSADLAPTDYFLK